MKNKKRRKQKLAATSRSWFADLLKDILGGVVTVIIIKLLKLDQPAEGRSQDGPALRF